MEILLLIVVIVLLLGMNAARNSRLRTIEDQLTNIEKYLKKLSTVERRAAEPKKAEAPAPVAASPPPPKPKPVFEELPPVFAMKAETPPEPKKEEPAPKPVLAETIEPVKPLAEPVRPVAEKLKPVAEPVAAMSPPPVKPKAPLAQPLPPEEDWYTRFRKNNPDLEKFIGENLVSKIGIAILVIGIAFFVKYAIDQNWINEVARVGIGILCGGIVLGFAHRLRLQFKAFSSVLVAGGISIFYFTIGIAFHQYGLFSQSAAFVIMVLITGFSVFISVAYNRVELAALSLVGGFGTPLMLSTGQGNYQVLFTYILILDIGMLVLAYLRNWNLINILAYAFTMLLYFGWLETKVIDQHGAPYAGALLFGSIFYVVFILMNVINNVRAKRPFKSAELSILLSNTFLFYAGGMQILYFYHPEARGLFNVLLALFNMVCSWLLYKKFNADKRLVYLLIGLTLTFITVAVPVQLNGHYITMAWALEAVLLLWLSQRSGMALYRFVSVAVTIITFMSLCVTWTNTYTTYADLHILLNKGFLTGLVASLSMLGVGLLLLKETETVTYLGMTFEPQGYRIFAFTGFVVLLYVTGMIELLYQLDQAATAPAVKVIVGGAYHLLYISLLNVAFRNAGKRLGTILYNINYASALLFIFVLSIQPLVDLRSSLLHASPGQAGFVFHYVNLLAALFLVYRLQLAQKSIIKVAEDRRTINTLVLSAAIVFLCSTELLLHVEKLAVTPPASMAEAGLAQYNHVKTHVIKTGFAILWGLLAFTFLFIGMRRHNKTLRIIGLVLIAIILLKLFLYDIRDASEAGKIIAFILLGVLLLIISFMYQKIKALLLDDKKETTAVTDAASTDQPSTDTP